MSKADPASNAGSRLRASLDHLADLERSGLWLERREHPRRAGLLPRARIGTGEGLDDQGQTNPRSRPAPPLSPSRAQRAPPVQVGRSGRIRPRRPPVVHGAGAASWPYPDRDPRALDWTRLELSIPEFVEPLQAIVQKTCTLPWVDRFSEGLKVVHVSQSDAECETPTAQVIQRDRLPSDLVDRLRDSGVIIGPMRSLSVTEAIALSATQVSPTGRPRGG
jgi:hypothetical protein